MRSHGLRQLVLDDKSRQLSLQQQIVKTKSANDNLQQARLVVAWETEDLSLYSRSFRGNKAKDRLFLRLDLLQLDEIDNFAATCLQAEPTDLQTRSG